MKKFFLLLMPLMMMAFTSCTKEDVRFQIIDMAYVNPSDGVISAEGGEITYMVGSSHSYKMSSTSDVVSFLRDGVVKYDKNGYAVVELNHEVHVSANNTGKERRILIEAQHTSNSEYRASLLFIQPAKVVEE